ncbi:MAG: hypothetical protein LBD32_02755, partial [Cytophagales bacterium]|nr:hypothetical protein [Cytophagales bacterium]
IKEAEVSLRKCQEEPWKNDIVFGDQPGIPKKEYETLLKRCQFALDENTDGELKTICELSVKNEENQDKKKVILSKIMFEMFLKIQGKFLGNLAPDKANEALKEAVTGFSEAISTVESVRTDQKLGDLEYDDNPELVKLVREVFEVFYYAFLLPKKIDEFVRGNDQKKLQSLFNLKADEHFIMQSIFDEVKFDIILWKSFHENFKKICNTEIKVLTIKPKSGRVGSQITIEPELADDKFTQNLTMVAVNCNRFMEVYANELYENYKADGKFKDLENLNKTLTNLSIPKEVKTAYWRAYKEKDLDRPLPCETKLQMLLEKAKAEEEFKKVIEEVKNKYKPGGLLWRITIGALNKIFDMFKDAAEKLNGVVDDVKKLKVALQKVKNVVEKGRYDALEADARAAVGEIEKKIIENMVEMAKDFCDSARKWDLDDDQIYEFDSLETACKGFVGQDFLSESFKNTVEWCVDCCRLAQELRIFDNKLQAKCKNEILKPDESLNDLQDSWKKNVEEFEKLCELAKDEGEIKKAMDTTGNNAPESFNNCKNSLNEMILRIEKRFITNRQDELLMEFYKNDGSWQKNSCQNQANVTISKLRGLNRDNATPIDLKKRGGTYLQGEIDLHCAFIAYFNGWVNHDDYMNKKNTLDQKILNIEQNANEIGDPSFKTAFGERVAKHIEYMKAIESATITIKQFLQNPTENDKNEAMNGLLVVSNHVNNIPNEYFKNKITNWGNYWRLNMGMCLPFHNFCETMTNFLKNPNGIHTEAEKARKAIEDATPKDKVERLDIFKSKLSKTKDSYLQFIEKAEAIGETYVAFIGDQANGTKKDVALNAMEAFSNHIDGSKVKVASAFTDPLKTQIQNAKQKINVAWDLLVAKNSALNIEQKIISLFDNFYEKNLCKFSDAETLHADTAKLKNEIDKISDGNLKKNVQEKFNSALEYFSAIKDSFKLCGNDHFFDALKWTLYSRENASKFNELKTAIAALE